jgi:hypothetical protein
LKVFRARSELTSTFPAHDGHDFTYREVKRDASADYDAG